jgi:endonuclease YncB( thermonuclease family)
MKKLLISLLFAFILPFFFISYAHAQVQTFKVLRVVDGDTIVVDVRGHNETVRLLGIDTPETVNPRKSVQCFGKAASDKMKTLINGKSIILIDDSTQGNRDKYKRLLRYVYLPDNKRTFINGEMVKQGYAFSYRQYSTKLLNKFNGYEAYAKAHNLGLWNACPINVTPTQKPATKIYTAPKSTYVAPTKVYVPPTTTSSVSTSSEGDKNCSDFATHAEAQSYFTSKGGSPSNNVDGLDRDHDGIACETLL